MIKSFEELTKTHPCFSVGSKVNKGRVHLPVSPGCNISCRFCDRQLNDVDLRPGVASTIITPREAVEWPAPATPWLHRMPWKPSA